MKKNVKTIFCLSVVMMGLFTFIKGKNVSESDLYSDDVLANVEALSFTENVNYLNGFRKAMCYRNDTTDGQSIPVLIGERCKRSYPDDQCNQLLTWGRCED